MKAFERLEALAGAESPHDDAVASSELLARGTAGRARHRRAREALQGPRGAAGCARHRRARAAVALGCTANRKRYNWRRLGPVLACSGNVLVGIGARIGMYSERTGRRI